MELVDKTQPAVAQFTPYSFSQNADILPIDQNLPTAGPIQTAKAVQQGTFTRAWTYRRKRLVGVACVNSLPKKISHPGMGDRDWERSWPNQMAATVRALHQGRLAELFLI